MNSCHECGGDLQVKIDSLVYDDTVHPLVSTQALIKECADCGAEIIPSEAKQRLEDAVRNTWGSPSTAEICELVKATGLPSEELSNLMGLAPYVVGQWERGEKHPDPSMTNFLRILGNKPATIKSLRKIHHELHGDKETKRKEN